MWRVFLVGHHPSLRAALARIIRDQSNGVLTIVGEACEDPDDVALIRAAQPEIVILVLGFEPSHELGMMRKLHHLLPGCQIVVIDTLGGAQTLEREVWREVDVLLRQEELVTELVPALRRLVVQRGAASSETGDDGPLPAT